MRVRRLLVVVLVVWSPAVLLNGQATFAPRARQVHDRAIVVDTHDDTTQRLINYNSPFLSEEYRVASDSLEWRAQVEAVNTACGHDEACAILERQRIDHEAMRAGRLPFVGWEKILEHIDRAVKVAGIDHVGLGSDFDGAIMPLGMEDASKLPAITDGLLNKGSSDADVQKILGGNLLRVMEQVERIAAGR